MGVCVSVCVWGWGVAQWWDGRGGFHPCLLLLHLLSSAPLPSSYPLVRPTSSERRYYNTSSTPRLSLTPYTHTYTHRHRRRPERGLTSWSWIYGEAGFPVAAGHAGITCLENVGFRRSTGEPHFGFVPLLVTVSFFFFWISLIRLLCWLVVAHYCSFFLALIRNAKN